MPEAAQALLHELKVTMGESLSIMRIIWGFTFRAARALLPLFCLGGAHAEWLSVPSAQPPDANPLKGFMPYRGSYDFPHSMEYQYFAFDDLMPSLDTPDFDTTIEPFLEEVSGRGNHAVFRIYLDYPDERYAVPQWLRDAGVTATSYSSHGGGLSPDYDHPALLAACESLISLLGARYDGDPRIGFLQVGLLGHWGEWHTYPNGHLFAATETQNRILSAFDNAFNSTSLLVSQDLMSHDPMANIDDHDIGFHDDAFTEGTLGPADWNFYPRLVDYGFDKRWRSMPVGGEILPGLQNIVWDDPSGAPQDYSACVNVTHASWLLNQAPFDSNWGVAKRVRAIEGGRRLGYDIRVVETRIGALDGDLRVGVRFENTGVAPFYYPWAIEVGVFGQDRELLISEETDWDVRTILPDGGPIEFTATVPFSTDWTDSFASAVRIVSPLANGKPFLFSNRNREEDWVILAEISQSLGSELEVWSVE